MPFVQIFPLVELCGTIKSDIVPVIGCKTACDRLSTMRGWCFAVCHHR